MGGNKREPSAWSDVGWYVGTGVDEDEEKEGRDIARQHVMALDMIDKIGELSDAETSHHTWGKVRFAGMPWFKREWEVLIDDRVENGAQIRITHVIRGHKGVERPTLYGRPVDPKGDAKYYDDMAAGRRNQGVLNHRRLAAVSRRAGTAKCSTRLCQRSNG